MHTCSVSQIEEEIHELTEYQTTDDESGHCNSVVTLKTTPKVLISKYPSMHSVDCILAELNHGEVRGKVPFPEYGVDLVGKNKRTCCRLVLIELLITPQFCYTLHSIYSILI